MSNIRRLPGADDDLVELADYLSSQSEEVADRFVDAVVRTLQFIVDRPGIGSPKRFADPDLADVRSWWVAGFPNHLIYYIPVEGGIDVLAILHGARDVEKLLRDRI